MSEPNLNHAFNLGRISNTILSRECGQPNIVLDFNGIALCFFPFRLMFGTGFLSIASIMFLHRTGIPDRSHAFNMKGGWNILKAFSVSIAIIM